MKGKTLNRGFGALVVVAIIGLGMVCGIGAGADDTTPVTAAMAAHIWIDTPASVSLTLAPDQTVTSEQTVSVKTNKNQNWKVQVHSDKSDGKLTAGSTSLSSALILSVGSNDYGPITTTDTEIYIDTSENNHKTGGTPRSITTILKQASTYDDGEGDYTGTLTFTASYVTP